MKHSPDPQEPRKWASGLSESDALTGHDDEIQANEDLLLEALGRPAQLESEAHTGDAPEGGVPAGLVDPRSEFRERLRAQFIGADAATGSAPAPALGESESTAGHDVAMDKLRDWSPSAPSAEFEDRLRGAFLDAAPEAGAHRHGSRRAAPQRKPRARRASNSKAGSPFKLYVVGGLLAAAAALLLFFQRPAAEEIPESVETEQVAKVEPSVTGPTTGSTTGPAPESAWELDADFGSVASLLAAVRVDGEKVASLAEFQQRMTSAERIETVGAEVRLRHRDEFMMELSAGAAVRLDDWADKPADGEARVLHAERGSLRVATGPGFDAIASLVVETPHIRTEVVGTIFGLDVGAGYTCVCCLEGTVRTQALGGGIGQLEVHAGKTWVADVADMSPAQIPLVAHHRAPLERLAGYWG